MSSSDDPSAADAAEAAGVPEAAAAAAPTGAVVTEEEKAKNANNVQFPWKLHELLSEAESSENSEIISWLPDANAFKVHDTVRFTSKILPAYFSATKYKSFQRNLNLWGFESIQDGPHRGACFHPHFIRGDREKCHYMTRLKIKGILGKNNNSSRGPRGAKGYPRVVPGIPGFAGTVKSSSLSAEDLKALRFPKKLHHILAQPEYADSLCWTPDGRCVRVVDPFKFQEKVAGNYFSHTSFSSFLVELESFGFKKVSHLGFEECYYHDLMIRGCPHLSKYIPEPQESRKFVSEDPVKDLVVDTAFGIPSIRQPAPATAGVTMPPLGSYVGGARAIMNSDASKAGTIVQELQQRQQFATLQLIAATGGHPGAHMGLGPFNQALLAGGVTNATRRANPAGSTPGKGAEQKSSTSTPISNFMANSYQNSNGGETPGNRPDAAF